MLQAPARHFLYQRAPPKSPLSRLTGSRHPWLIRHAYPGVFCPTGSRPGGCILVLVL
jgi:hypothetical protein